MIRNVHLDVSVASPTIPNARHVSRTDARPPRSAAPSPKLSPKDKDPLDFAKYSVSVSSKKHCVPMSMSMSAWGSLSSPTHMADHLPSSLALPAAARRKLSPTTKCDDKVDQKTARAQIRSGPGSGKKQVVGSVQAWRAQNPHTFEQLGWDGVSEDSWDKLRAKLIAQHHAAPDLKSPSFPTPQIVSGITAASGRPSSRPSYLQRTSSELPFVPPKIKPSPLSNEYRVLKSGLQRAQERASVILQELDSNLADSDHMITLDPRWLAHFSENHDEDTEPDQFEISIQNANKMLDFLNQKQREQEACEAMMQQLLDTFNAIDHAPDAQDFGQVVRPSTIADSTGDWGGLQPDLEIQLMIQRRTDPFQASASSHSIPRPADLEGAIQELESRHMQDIVKLAHDMSVQHAKAMEVQRKELDAKDLRIDNVVATLGKVLKEREFLKNELQRAGHQNVISKMKQVALSERDMLKSIKDQITGKPSAAVLERGTQTMDVQFADDKDSDSDSASVVVPKSSQVISAAPLLDVKGGSVQGDLASAFKNIYDSDKTSKGKKKAKVGQDWSFIDIDAFAKEAMQQGTTFQAIVADIKLPKEWQKSLTVSPKAGDDVRGRILTVRVLLKILNDIYTERFKAGASAGPLVTFVQEYFLERYGLKELANVHLRNFVTSVIMYSKTDGNRGPGIIRTVTFAGLVGMFKAYGAAELDWFFSCRQDLFTHVDQLCCFDLDDSATKVTTTRALDHIRRMFVTLQVSAERTVREMDEIEKNMKEPRAMFQLATCKKGSVQKFAEKVMRSNMKPIDLLLKQSEDVIDVDLLFARLIDTFSEFHLQRRQKLQRAFMDADEDGDGEMDFDEFKALCTSIGRGIKAPQVRAMFREMTSTAEDSNTGITPDIFATVALKHNLDRMIGGAQCGVEEDDENVGSWDALLDTWTTDNWRILNAIAMIPDPLPDSAKTKAMLRDSKIEMDDILEKRDGLCGRRQAWTKYRFIMKKTSEIQRKNEILAKVSRIMKGKKPNDKIMHAGNLLRLCMRRRWIRLHLRDFSNE